MTDKNDTRKNSAAKDCCACSEKHKERSPEEYKAHNDFNQLFVDTVRATGGNNAQRNLMVQIYSGACGDGAFENFVLPTDSTEVTV